MVEDAPISKLADLTLEMPWAFDDSVCQTRTVTNLYAANLIITGILSGDEKLLTEIKSAIDAQELFMTEYKDVIKDAADLDWDNAVVLADVELEGIAKEGAMAFKEICQLKSNYYHLLDSRHGPMVLFDDKTIVIAAKTPFDDKYQTELLKDIKSNGSYIICVSDNKEGIEYADINITIPSYENYAAAGIHLIFLPQALSFYKALAIGVNPDVPRGLDPWIKL